MSGSLVPPPDAVLPDRPPTAPAPGTELAGHGGHCFGCGRDDGLGIRFRAGEGLSVRSEFVASERHPGAPGYLHGGLISSAFDECLGAPGMIVGLPAMTARLEVDFRAPVPVGATVVVTSRITGMAGRKIYTSGEMTITSGGSGGAGRAGVAVAPDGAGGAGGLLAATAVGLYVRIDPAAMAGR